MPLPMRDTAWPPPQLAPVRSKLAEWDAWWTGDPEALTKTYKGTVAPTPPDRPAQRGGGVVGALARFWWGRPTQASGQRRDGTHVPLAADIARACADLLFAEPLDITVGETASQKRIDDLLAEATYSTLTGAAEQCSALGCTYRKAAWDRDVADSAFLVAEPADRAVPEFSYGRLRAVTFWRVVARDGQQVWRRLERHELDQGDGVVQHGLYAGTNDRLGRAVPLADRPETEPLAGSVNEFGYVTDGVTPGLDVVYVPNAGAGVAKPWRHVPPADEWGASDFSGVEGFLDNLDEAYSSWMRDIRLGKARILVAQYMLDDHGPGQGAGFDLDRDMHSPLKMAAQEDGQAPITPHQFSIRHAEHEATVAHWTDKSIGSAGYSPQTFGRQGDGDAMTATEVAAREGRTTRTRGRNTRVWTPALRQILDKLLAVDAKVFGSGVSAEGLAVSFPDGGTETPESRARTAQLLKTAGAASTQTLVRMTNPDLVGRRRRRGGCPDPG